MQVLGDSLSADPVGVCVFVSPPGLTLAPVQSNSGQLFSISSAVSIPCSQSSYLHPVKMKLAVDQLLDKASFLPSRLYRRSAVSKL